MKLSELPHWEWLSGTHACSGGGKREFVVLEPTPSGSAYFLANPSSPLLKWVETTDLDLESPATLGCLLHLVRKAWQMPRGITVHYSSEEGAWIVSWSGSTHGGECGRGATEGEALLAALMSAP